VARATLVAVAMILALFVALHVRLSLGIVDPQAPSVYNLGSGGTSSIYFALGRRLRADVEVVPRLSDIKRFPPTRSVLIIASPDYPITRREAEELRTWVERGGVVIVLDETPSSKEVFKLAGVSIETPLLKGIAVALCRMRGANLSVLLNYYVLLSSGTAKPLCYANGGVVGYVSRVGLGSIYVFGDSSIIINEHMSTPYAAQVLLLMRMIAGNRTFFLFYEGGRAYRILPGLERLPLLALLTPFAFLELLGSAVLGTPNIFMRFMLLGIAVLFTSLYAITRLYSFRR